MTTKYLYKDTFAVIGKAGQGLAYEIPAWVLPLWKDANDHFMELTGIVRQDENGAPLVWGAMNDVDESNKRWSESGKYMAGYEADKDANPPEGWTKWIIPAQTYMIVECTMETYGEVFGKITNDPNIKIVGTVHERYPQPANPNIVELYFPIAEGMTLKHGSQEK